MKNIIKSKSDLDNKLELDNELDPDNKLDLDTEIISLQNDVNDSKNKISDLGLSLNSVRGQVSLLKGRVLGIETSKVIEETI